jgi:serine phosphatase RsbU (regulator of sigma subunit)
MFIMPSSLTPVDELFAAQRALNEAVLEQLNAFLCEGNDTCLFVTLFCGYLEPTRGTLTYSNAGHLPPLLIDYADSWGQD